MVKVITGVLVILVLASGVGVIYSTHLTRSYFTQLQQLEKESEKLNTLYGKLLLEESALSAPARIENKARERGMINPKTDQIKVLQEQP
ncbi:cell division protein FtsL [Gynuella sp.]|uniref:cell division protein FtsL n=1 Tax=Gynuella sp. TaxID=2969146 RepID=UPI003D13E271